MLVTKYRKRALAGIESTVETALRAAARNGQFELVEFGCGGGDHVHCVLRLEPTVSVAQVVRRLKQLTTLHLWAVEQKALRKYYWRKDRRLLWSSGYYCATVGDVSKSTVLEYVRKQSA